MADQTLRAEPVKQSRARRIAFRLLVVSAIVLLLFGVPCWTLLFAGTRWPTPVLVVGTLAFAAAVVALLVTMVWGHGRRHLDWAAVTGDVLLGAVWVLFVWSVLSQVLRLALLVFGVGDPVRSRIVAAAVVVVVIALLVWGHFEAMRVPRVRHVDVTIPRLGAGLDGPLDRADWSAAVVDRVNELDADVVCHLGDIADGTVDMREAQAAPLARVHATRARVYVTGKHEYFSEVEGWLEYMQGIGWETLRNRHIVVERGGDALVIAGVDDETARGSGLDGHGADVDAALVGADPTLPLLLLAHQPKQVARTVAAGVDLQLSGHTPGGQIWPFNFLVRLDPPPVPGGRRDGERTQLYTSRGTGFWGPPFRVFAPSELTVVTLRSL